MGVVKIGISLPRPLLDRVDALARHKRQSRSEFVRQSLERTLAEEIPPHVLAEARELYAAVEADDRALAEGFLAVAAETLPPYDEAGGLPDDGLEHSAP
jgi:metal-responsive CopG/Arc/MetJ family transcriptional regulator